MNTTGPATARRRMWNSFLEIGAKKGSRKPTTPAGPTCTVPGAFMFS